MNQLLRFVCVVAVTAFVCACEELPSQPAHVWGYVSPSILNSPMNVSGTLGQDGERNYGFCTYQGDTFTFGLGNAKPTSTGAAGTFYMTVNGISGPPTKGVYSGGEPKNSDSLHKRFSGATFRQGSSQSWTLGKDEMPDAEDCYVTLFASALETELLPSVYGHEPFDYYVRIECMALDVPDAAGQGVNLRSFYVELYFDGCKE